MFSDPENIIKNTTDAKKKAGLKKVVSGSSKLPKAWHF